MANINPEENYIQIEETRFRAPVSEATLTRMGASINFLLDKIPFNVEKIEFLSSTTWIAPSNALFGIIEGVGGGGGGSASAGGSGFGDPKGGAGGSSGVYFCVQTSINPNLSYPVIIGAGGSGGPVGFGVNQGQPGANGLDSSFGSIVFPGGKGGRWDGTMFVGGGRFNNREYNSNSMARGGNGQSPYVERISDGESFKNFSGGLPGVGTLLAPPGSGGGAGPFGNGGNGGNNLQPGFSANANSGAGGGGGGASGILGGASLAGGNGGSGRIILWLFTKA